MLKNYEELVYAGVLGKVIGVYMGRPFEGWWKDALVKRWGLVNRYVHEDQGVPLVVADDDITGTFTFARILEDSGQYADTPVERFGDNWLNYIVPFKSILWWGGMGTSTEHTAFIRLQKGVKAPASGSIALNGRTVAEQIGAQIFIDAFGLVAPGKPELAAELARKAGSVSHDGEAVHGAVVVAAMVAAAFEEKDMDRILDAAIAFVPKDSTIAAVHRDVRSWCRQDKDWHRTYQRIAEKYGYDKFGGGCHMVPNHAIMVMAWCYAPDDFQQSQAIINTAGWDTDCNAANVGTVMGVKLGLAGINQHYDFQGPMADRLLLPTAEGSRGVSDCLSEALAIAAMGRRIMGWPAAPKPKAGALHHFSLPGSLHGWMSEEDSFQTRGCGRVSNVASGAGRAMLIEAQGLCDGRLARVSTPTYPKPQGFGYGLMGSPRLSSGQTMVLVGRVDAAAAGATARLFGRYADKESGEFKLLAFGESASLVAGKPLELRFAPPATEGWPFCDMGIQIEGRDQGSARIIVESVDIIGGPALTIPGVLPADKKAGILGWVSDLDGVNNPMHYRFADMQGFRRDATRGHLVTGTQQWTDYDFTTEFAVHCADKAGILVRYQGLRRYIALVKTADAIQLVRPLYEEKVLAEKKLAWNVDEVHSLRLTAKGNTITAWCDGAKLFEHKEDVLLAGGVGYLVETGVAGFRKFSVTSL
jgi:ADP-ribosylglycohydrolase